ncbi:hypothetical protein BJX65DRAFT_192728 [Aspergillus insuetus]
MSWKQSNKSTVSSSTEYAVLCWGSHRSGCRDFGKDKAGALALLPCGCFGFTLAMAMFQSPNQSTPEVRTAPVRSRYVTRRLFNNEPAADPLQTENAAPRQRKPTLRYRSPTRDTESSIDQHRSMLLDRQPSQTTTVNPSVTRLHKQVTLL